jgi:acyl-CoA dehydrogenase
MPLRQRKNLCLRGTKLTEPLLPLMSPLMSPPTSHLDLPFFGAEHRALAEGLLPWAAMHAEGAGAVDESDDRAACREWVKRLGAGGWLRWCVPAGAQGELGGALPELDSRALVVLRETLAFHSPLADFAFAMQGLGSGAISLAGTPAQQRAWLPDVAAGKKIAAFALSEPQAGSDVAAIATQASRTASGWQLNGTKTWISNGGIADFYCIFARTREAAEARTTQGLSCLVLDAKTAGLDDSEAIHVMAPHPLAVLKLNQCELPDSALIGIEGGGFKLAMQTLDIFRASVAGAALGFARRALVEATAYARARKMFGQTLADFQLTQAKLGEMAALIDAAALLTYRAAWMRDVQKVRTTSEAAMAKLSATENAQRVIDAAVQMHGGQGVRVGSKVESLYRDIRSLRIYEGATEVQQLIIGKALVKG